MVVEYRTRSLEVLLLFSQGTTCWQPMCFPRFASTGLYAVDCLLGYHNAESPIVALTRRGE
jgi:hypothetical protein